MELLEKYEVIPNELRIDDRPRFISLKEFFDIKLSKIIKVKDIVDGKYVFRDIKNLSKMLLFLKNFSK